MFALTITADYDQFDGSFRRRAGHFGRYYALVCSKIKMNEINAADETVLK